MAKRISKSSVNWAALAERVPPNQRPFFNSFKTRSDVHIRAVLANPEKAPTIDWEYYKKLIPISGLVDKFQKEYTALQVPYPADKVSAQIDEQIKETQTMIADFKQISNARIETFEKTIKYLQSLLPYDQMTMEDYYDSFPEVALDPAKRPTFWPHTADEQPGYKDKDAPQAGGH